MSILIGRNVEPFQQFNHKVEIDKEKASRAEMERNKAIREKEQLE